MRRRAAGPSRPAPRSSAARARSRPPDDGARSASRKPVLRGSATAMMGSRNAPLCSMALGEPARVRRRELAPETAWARSSRAAMRQAPVGFRRADLGRLRRRHPAPRTRSAVSAIDGSSKGSGASCGRWTAAITARAEPLLPPRSRRARHRTVRHGSLLDRAHVAGVEAELLRLQDAAHDLPRARFRRSLAANSSSAGAAIGPRTLRTCSTSSSRRGSLGFRPAAQQDEGLDRFALDRVGLADHGRLSDRPDG